MIWDLEHTGTEKALRSRWFSFLCLREARKRGWGWSCDEVLYNVPFTSQLFQFPALYLGSSSGDILLREVDFVCVHSHNAVV